jgi:hypothetical protein
VAPDVLQRVIGDPLRLRQILFNLLGNALKFTEVGAVKLSLERATADALCIKVADTGIGLTTSSASGCSNPSCRPTARPRAASAAPALACRSCAAWPKPWAAASQSRAPPASVRPSPSR